MNQDLCAVFREKRAQSRNATQVELGITDVGSREENIVQDDSKTFDTVDLTSIYRDNKRA